MAWETMIQGIISRWVSLETGYLVPRCSNYGAAIVVARGNIRLGHVRGMLGPEGVHVVEQAPCLVLLGVQPGQPHQTAGVVAGVDHLRTHPDGAAIDGGFHVDLGDVEAERVEATHAPIQPVQLGLIDAGDLTRVVVAPQSETLEWARGTVPHPLGEIEVRWQVRGDTLFIDVGAPDGVTVEIAPRGRLAKLKLNQRRRTVGHLNRRN